MKTQKAIDFKGILAVIQDIIAYTKGMKVKKEDASDGEEREFQISDMSVSCIFVERMFNNFQNGFIEEEDIYSVEASMLVCLWFKNGKKVYKETYGKNDLPLHPENMKIYLKGTIYSFVHCAIDSFFISRVKDNKYSILPEFKGEVYFDKTKPIRGVSQSTLDMIAAEGKALYKIPNAMYSENECVVMKKTKVVADTSGTAVIESNDYCTHYSFVQYLTAKKTMLTPTAVRLYKSESAMKKDFSTFNAEFRQVLDNIHDYVMIPSGCYPILMDPAAVHTLFHEALGAHMFSGSYIANDISMVFKDKIGTNLARYNDRFEAFRDMSIYCEPNNKRLVASYMYDNEGTRSKDVCLLNRGVVTSFLTDRNSSERLNLEPGGHALAETFYGITPDGRPTARPPEPRVSNLRIKSHVKFSLEDMRQQIVQLCEAKTLPFYLEVSSKNGQVDVETGNFAMFLENIKVCYLDGTKKNVLGGSLTGDLFSFVSAIKGISSTYGEDIGMCGSVSGFVPTHGITPYMCFFGINFVPNKPPEEKLDYDLARDKAVIA